VEVICSIFLSSTKILLNSSCSTDLSGTIAKLFKSKSSLIFSFVILSKLYFLWLGILNHITCDDIPLFYVYNHFYDQN